MAELADALASGASGGNPVEVQVLLPALFYFSLSVKTEGDIFLRSLKFRKNEPPAVFRPAGGFWYHSKNPCTKGSSIRQLTA